MKAGSQSNGSRRKTKLELKKTKMTIRDNSFDFLGFTHYVGKDKNEESEKRKTVKRNTRQLLQGMDEKAEH